MNALQLPHFPVEHSRKPRRKEERGLRTAFIRALGTLALCWSVLCSAGCQSTPVLDTSGAEDLGGDGQTLLEGDCNDRNPSIASGAPEECDGLDNDCDTVIDEDVGQLYYQDNDVDGFGEGVERTGGCTLSANQSANNLDCDDTRADVYPDAPETCDGVDNNCNGDVDRDTPDYQKSLYYQDFDGDGFGNEEEPVYDCALEAPEGASALSGDCNDRSDFIYPSAEESCDSLDNDCDGDVDEDFAADGVISCEFCNGIDDDHNGTIDDGFDQDEDGFTAREDCTACLGSFDTCGRDCDDADPEVNPAAVEVCDASDVDEDCNDLSDDEDSGVVKEEADIWYVDRDQDGYGILNPSGVPYRFCDPPSGYAAVPGDCNDSKASVNPNAAEVTDNGIDENCDAYEVCYQDADEDTFRKDATATMFSTTLDCTGPQAAKGTQPIGDCDDTDPAIYPLAAERCNQADDDCDGKTDEEALDLSIPEECNQRDDNCNGLVDDNTGDTWYQDADRDGFGTSSTTRISCTAPTGFVSLSGDCNDSSPTIYPGASELCDGVDQSCNGVIDENATNTVVWYQDQDGDGYGDPKKTRQACSAPDPSYVSNAIDCDDASATIYPGAAESCNTQDDDCNGKVDEGVTNICGKCGAIPSEVCNTQDDDCDGSIDEGVGDTWYQDADRDGYGTSSVTRISCTEPTGFVSIYGDCNDTDPNIFPSAPERCDGVDQSCNGTLDENATDASTWYKDQDSDGYGDPKKSKSACTVPDSTYVSNAFDCDDTSATIYPSAAESCNTQDDDCDGKVDEGTTNACGTCGTVPTETCNGLDDNCDGAIDNNVGDPWYQDADADGYGNASKSRQACDQPVGYVDNSRDCNDTNPSINPVAVERCNGVDDNCDGSTDGNNSSDASIWYYDGDADGYGKSSSTVLACSRPAGYVSNDDDCDDTNKNISPVGTETCDLKDNDCDGQTDEGVKKTYYQDQDADGYGSSNTTEACSVPAGYSATSGDCDDSIRSIYPNATETCSNGLDDNCNGITDDDSVCKCTWELWVSGIYINSTGEGKTWDDPAEMQVRVPYNGSTTYLPSPSGWYHMVNGDYTSIGFLMTTNVVDFNTNYSYSFAFQACEVGGDGDHCASYTITDTFKCDGGDHGYNVWTNPQSGIDALTYFTFDERQGL